MYPCRCQRLVSILCRLLEKLHSLHCGQSVNHTKSRRFGRSIRSCWLDLVLAVSTLANLSSLALARRSLCESLLFSLRLLMLPRFLEIFLCTLAKDLGIFSSAERFSSWQIVHRHKVTIQKSVGPT